MYFPGREKRITMHMCCAGRGTHIKRNMCCERWEHISLGICVFQVKEHKSLGICVSEVREHITLEIWVSQVGQRVSEVGEHISLGIRVYKIEERISPGIWVSRVGDHISQGDVRFSGWQTNQGDMCLPNTRAHITRDTSQVGEHKSLGICLSQVRKHI